MKRDIEAIMDKYIAMFDSRQLNCAETAVMILGEYLGVDSPLLPRIATAFGGGIAGSRSVCGIVTGALMAVGMCTGRDIGGDQAPARELGSEFMGEFARERGALTCLDLTGLDLRDPEVMKAFHAPGGGHDRVCTPCMRWACRYLADKLGGQE